jgi:hypothetical protein
MLQNVWLVLNYDLLLLFIINISVQGIYKKDS